MEDNYNQNVFVNCPYDNEYKPFQQAIIFAVVACGFKPQLVSYNTNGGVPRIEKIKEMIDGAKLGIHDISRCKSTMVNEWYRLNMPFELGLDLGSKHFSERHKYKNVLVLQAEPFSHQPSLSDYAGFDPQCYEGECVSLLTIVRRFLYSEVAEENRDCFIQRGKLESLYWDFQKELYADFGGVKEEIDKLSDLEYCDKIKHYMSCH